MKFLCFFLIFFFSFYFEIIGFLIFLIEINLKVHSIEIMGQTVDYYLSNLKTNKLKLLKQRLLAFGKADISEEPSLVPSLVKFTQPISLPLTPDNEE